MVQPMIRLGPLLQLACVYALSIVSTLAQAMSPNIVINEVHHDDAPKTSRGEFIELYNAGDQSVDLSGWLLEGVGAYEFPTETLLEPDQFLVIAEDARTLRTKFRIRTTHQYSGGLDNDGDDIRLLDHNGALIDRVDYRSGFPWPAAARGTGASMELLHPSLDNNLGGSWRSSTQPTPGARNSVYSLNIPPQIRQVNHEPQQPQSGDDVTLTVKVTDPDGVLRVTLSYQLVEPGRYIRKRDRVFETQWTELTMEDNGQDGDALAGDDIHTITLPSSLHQHRVLVRYRITAEDARGNKVTVPYSDDESPNFAFFVYDGVPAWSGSKRPRISPTLEYPQDMMNQALPVYHLIANKTDVENSQYNRSYDGRRMSGTLVYDGIVYDHIQFYNRGEASTYVSGKNKWRFRFNRTHDFEGRDNYGKRYKADWKTLNLNACASPWVASNRGIAGLDEAVPHRLYQLAGVPGSNTHWIQFRIVDAEVETPNDQFGGDLWGLYLAIEHPDSRFLAERQLPDRSTYEITGNRGDKKNQGPEQPLDLSDWEAFWNQSNRLNTVEWWESNFDLESFYGFRAINRATGNVDLRDGANYYMFQHADGRWTPLPWDLDMMYAPIKHVWSGVIRADRCLDHSFIRIGFKNRCRELIDLLFSDISRHGGQAAQLVQELSLIVNPPRWPLNMVDVDEAMWSFHPRTSGSHRGPWYRLSVNETRLASSYRRTIPTQDHEGFQQSIIDYMFDTRTDGSFRVNDAMEDGYGFGYLSQEASASAIPNRPGITYTGESGFPVDRLQFTSSAFINRRDPDGFAWMEWRIGEVMNPETSGYTKGTPWTYEIEPLWHSGPIATFSEAIEIPPTRLKPGHTYRARVRHFNVDGHASHWSEPLEFVASEPDLTNLRNGLVISEIMYHPSESATAEYIELHNISNTSIPLTGVRFTKGIDFNFTEGSEIEPGGYLLIIGDKAAFEQVHGTGLPIAGVWEQGDRLSNSGETIKLSYGAGSPIIEFEYQTEAPWPGTPDREGYSLQFAHRSSGMDPANPEHWKASAHTGGTPGRGEGMSLETWLRAFGLTESELQEDQDQDGLPTLLEYGLGSHPHIADATSFMSITHTESGIRLKTQLATDATDVQVSAQYSTNLKTWETITQRETTQDPPTAIEWAPPLSSIESPKGFFRLQATRR